MSEYDNSTEILEIFIEAAAYAIAYVDRIEDPEERTTAEILAAFELKGLSVATQRQSAESAAYVQAFAALQCAVLHTPEEEMDLSVHQLVDDLLQRIRDLRSSG